jgi:hypothetical protein
VILLGLWTLEYYDDGVEDWVEFTGRIEEIVEELSGHEEVSFSIPNTAANRSFVASDQIVRIFFDDTQLYLGVLYDVEYSKKQLKCIVYNGVYELLKRRVISGEYIGYMASSVAEYIRQAAGLTNMINCPADNVDMIFDQTLCFDAIVQLAEALNKDYWVENGDSLNIGDRGSAQSFDGNIANVSERVVGRSKKRDKVHVRGVSNEGEEIMGYAGEGDDVAVFWNDFPTTEANLFALAAKKLADINMDDSSVTLTCPITSGYHLHPGDTITLSKPELNLDGSYQIVKTTKRRKIMDIEIIRQKLTTEKVLEELSKGTIRSYSLTTFISQFGGGEVTEIGVGSTFIRSFFAIPATQISTPSVAAIATAVDTEISTPTVASIDTVVGIEVNPP